MAQASVSFVELDSTAAPIDVRVAWLEFDTAAGGVQATVSWVEFDTAVVAAVQALVSWFEFDVGSAGGAGNGGEWLIRMRRRRSR